MAYAFSSKGDYSNGMFAWGKKFNTLTKILSHLHMVKAHDLRAPWRIYWIWGRENTFLSWEKECEETNSTSNCTEVILKAKGWWIFQW